MDKKEIRRSFIIIGVIALLLILTGGTPGFFAGRANPSIRGGMGDNSEAQRRINNEIRREQSIALDGIRGGQGSIIESQSGIRDGVRAFERIGGISNETDSALSELRELDKRSGDISTLIKAEINLLENCGRCPCGGFSGDGSGIGSE